jgi:hypothetical protein
VETPELNRADDETAQVAPLQLDEGELLRAAWRFERGLRRRERARERDLLERLREKAQAQANHLRELDAALETVLRRGDKGPSSTSPPAGH